MRRVALILLMSLAACTKEKSTVAPVATGSGAQIVVGSKNFTESVILGELLAQKLEASGCTVERRLNMGGTLVCDSAIRSGALDTYAEYSGTALTAILKKPIDLDRAAVEQKIAAGYQSAGLVWGPPLGFNNTFAMIVRKDDAAKYGLTRVSDLKKVQSQLQPGFGYEFVERPDGWKGLLAKYGLAFKASPKTMDLGLTYKALASHQIDLIAGNSTDGLIDSLGLVILEDDLHYFPPYDAAVVRRADLEAKCGGASKALESLRGKIDDATMRRLNYAVDGEKKDVTVVVREWLKK